jgi:hypothetical protein
MDLENFIRFLKKIERKYGWRNHMTNYDRENNVRLFKYVTFNLDTRDMTVWRVGFLLGGEETVFNLETKADIKEMYEWISSSN